MVTIRLLLLAHKTKKLRPDHNFYCSFPHLCHVWATKTSNICPAVLHVCFFLLYRGHMLAHVCMDCKNSYLNLYLSLCIYAIKSLTDALSCIHYQNSQFASMHVIDQAHPIVQVANIPTRYFLMHAQVCADVGVYGILNSTIHKQLYHVSSIITNSMCIFFRRK